MAAKELINGKHYFTAVRRGTQYTLHRHSDGWGVATRRLGYGGASHMGGFKFFDTLADVAAGCKAFGDAGAVVAMVYGLTAEAVAA